MEKKGTTKRAEQEEEGIPKKPKTMSETAPILFYREQDHFGILSNYYRLSEQPIYFGKKPYATAEHLFQALKFIYPGASADSLRFAELIRNANTPNKARILARLKCGGGYRWRTDLNEPIRRFTELGVRLRPDWDDVRLDVMLFVLREKFRQSPRARQALLDTGKAPLVEHSPRDSFWGDCGRGETVGPGQNHLGRLLASVREELRQQTTTATTSSAADAVAAAAAISDSKEDGKHSGNDGSGITHKSRQLKRKRQQSSTVITIKL